jgi:hypothetical protein
MSGDDRITSSRVFPQMFPTGSLEAAVFAEQFQ